MSKIITGHGDFYGYLSEAQVVFQLGGRKQHKHSPSWLLNHIKAAKYNQLVAQHCFVCKFWVDVSRFSPCVINLSRNKYLCCGLKKVVAKSRAWVYFEQQILVLLLVFHQTRNLPWIHTKQINQSARCISSTLNKCFFLRLACSCEETYESVWSPNASQYASSTCVHSILGQLICGKITLRVFI